MRRHVPRGRPRAAPQYGAGAADTMTAEASQAELKRIKGYVRAAFLANYLSQVLTCLSDEDALFDVAGDKVAVMLAKGNAIENAASPQQLEQVLTFLKEVHENFKAQRTDTLLDALPLILLDDEKFEDTKGIRTEMSKRLAGLELPGQQSRKKDEFAMGPLLDLDERGLVICFDSPEARGVLKHILEMMGVVRTKIAEGDSPTVESYERSTFQLIIPHQYVNQFIKTLQFQPHYIDPVVSDLYTAVAKQRKASGSQPFLTRAHYLLQAAASAAQVEDASTMPVYVPEDSVARLPHPSKVDVDIIAVDVAARVPQTSTREHIVILFDDSGSMNYLSPSPISVANQAVKKLLNDLPDNTLISLQPFNKDTVFCRISAKSARATFQSLPASGGTPLVEMLMASAVFMRPTADNPLILAEEMDRTAVVLLTDGQPNGVSGAAAVAAMRTTRVGGYRYPKQRNVIRDGLSDENWLSYGTDAMPCRQLPVIFPISIGADADRNFMQALAKELDCPTAHVPTGEGCEQALNDAFEILQQMRSRISRAYVGFVKSDGECLAATETRTLFNARQRRLFFEVPAGEQLRVQVKVDDQHRQYSVPTAHNFSHDNQQVILQAYFIEQYLDIKMAYDEALALAAPLVSEAVSPVSRVAGRRCQAPARAVPAAMLTPAPASEAGAAEQQATHEAKEKAALKAREQLYLETLTKLTSLQEAIGLSGLADREVFSMVTKFSVALEQAGKNQDYAAMPLHQNLEFMVAHTQGRVLGKPVKQVTAAPAKDDAFELCCQQIEADRSLDFQVLEKMILKNPSWVNQQRQDQHQNTLWMLLLRRWKRPELTPQERDNIALLVERVFKTSGEQILLTIRDTTGNTVLHNAAWWGAGHILSTLLEQAKNNNQLDQLRALRNTNSVGATVGETVLDNIFRSPAFEQDPKAVYAAALYADLKPENEAVAFGLLRQVASGTLDLAIFKEVVAAQPDLNARSLGRFEQYGTLLHCLLYQSQNTEVRKDIRIALKTYVLDLLKQRGKDIKLDAQNLTGQTVLHTSVWYGHIDVAHSILMVARDQGSLKTLLTLRNRHNETALMLIAQMAKSVKPDNRVRIAEIFNVIQPCLSVLQIAELAGTLRLYDKSLAGYSVFWHLDRWPVDMFHRILKSAKSYEPQDQNNTGRAILMSELEEQLTDLRPSNIDNTLVWVVTALGKPENKTAFEGMSGGIVKVTFEQAKKMLDTMQTAVKQHLKPAADVSAAAAMQQAHMTLFTPAPAAFTPAPAAGPQFEGEDIKCTVM